MNPRWNAMVITAVAGGFCCIRSWRKIPWTLPGEALGHRSLSLSLYFLKSSIYFGPFCEPYSGYACVNI